MLDNLIDNVPHKTLSSAQVRSFLTEHVHLNALGIDITSGKGALSPHSTTFC
jgi:hypothetical protein